MKNRKYITISDILEKFGKDTCILSETGIQYKYSVYELFKSFFARYESWQADDDYYSGDITLSEKVITVTEVINALKPVVPYFSLVERKRNKKVYRTEKDLEAMRSSCLLTAQSGYSYLKSEGGCFVYRLFNSTSTAEIIGRLKKLEPAITEHEITGWGTDRKYFIPFKTLFAENEIAVVEDANYVRGVIYRNKSFCEATKDILEYRFSLEYSVQLKLPKYDYVLEDDKPDLVFPLLKEITDFIVNSKASIVVDDCLVF